MPLFKLPGRKPVPPERRTAFRQACRLDCYCNIITLVPGYPQLPAKARDISQNGIGLIARGAIEPGTFLMLDLQAEMLPRRPLRVKVTRAIPRKQHMGWFLGCEFSPPLTGQEFKALSKSSRTSIKKGKVLQKR